MLRFKRPNLGCPNEGDRKSTRLNSSHGYISYAVFCLKKKKRRPEAHGKHRASHSGRRAFEQPCTPRGCVAQKNRYSTRPVAAVVVHHLCARRRLIAR